MPAPRSVKEEDIRPTNLRTEVRRLFDKEAEALLRFSDRFVDVPCPACGRENDNTYLEKKGYRYRRCENCRTAYISPRPTPDLLKDYYTNNEAARFWQTHVFPETRKGRVEGIYSSRVDLIQKLVEEHKMKNGIFVEVGAGSGIFGEEVAKKNLFRKIILVEPGPLPLHNTDVVEVVNDAIENVTLAEKADFIANFELIEHLFSPEDFLRKIYQLLRPKGLFLFTTPNLEGLELLTVGEQSYNLAGPDHLTVFNLDSIKHLVKRVGFSKVEAWTPGELDCDIIRNKHLEGSIDLKSHPFLHYVLIEKPEKYAALLQSFLKSANLSSHMMVLAEK